MPRVARGLLGDIGLRIAFPRGDDGPPSSSDGKVLVPCLETGLKKASVDGGDEVPLEGLGGGHGTDGRLGIESCVDVLDGCGRPEEKRSLIERRFVEDGLDGELGLLKRGLFDL